MTQKELIRQEIERRIKLYSITNEKEQWIVNTYWSVLSFIDSLPEEKPSEDLEEAAKEYVDKVWLFGESWVDVTRDTFKAGAEWQKSRLTVEDIKTILDISFWNDDPEKILDEYNRLHKIKT